VFYFHESLLFFMRRKSNGSSACSPKRTTDRFNGHRPAMTETFAAWPPFGTQAVKSFLHLDTAPFID